MSLENGGRKMIDHLDIHVQDLSRAKNFYTAVLASLGGHLIDESNSGLTYQTGKNADGYIWFEIGEPYPFHFAFQAKINSEVDEFYKKALENGGRDNGAPGYRIEAACHTGKE